jgi:hypothetical protein
MEGKGREGIVFVDYVRVERVKFVPVHLSPGFHILIPGSTAPRNHHPIIAKTHPTAKHGKTKHGTARHGTLSAGREGLLS